MIYTLNANTLGITEYREVPITALTVHDGKLYGVSLAGLLEEADGGEVNAHVETGEIDFGDLQRQKFCVEGRLNGIFPAGVSIDAMANEYGATQGWLYPVQRMRGDVPRMRKVKFGKGLRAMAWAFRISNVDGGQMQLDSFSVAPVLAKPQR